MLMMTFQLSVRLKKVAVQYWTTSKNNLLLSLLSQAKKESLAQFARRFLLGLPRPGRVQEQVTAGRGADNSENHIEPARLSFIDLLIAN